MANMTDGADTASAQRRLDTAPPRPPRSRADMSVMQMASDNGGDQSTLGMDMSSPAMQLQKSMGIVRQEFLKMSAIAPPMAMGLQQILSGLEQVVPQMAADIVSGNPPGSGGASMGAPQAPAAPTAPPVQQGMG